MPYLVPFPVGHLPRYIIQLIRKKPPQFRTSIHSVQIPMGGVSSAIPFLVRNLKSNYIKALSQRINHLPCCHINHIYTVPVHERPFDPFGTIIQGKPSSMVSYTKSLQILFRCHRPATLIDNITDCEKQLRCQYNEDEESKSWRRTRDSMADAPGHSFQ